MNKSNTKKSGSLILPIIMWGSVVAFYFYEFFIRVSPSVISNELMNHFGISAGSLGTLVGSYYLIYTIMQIPFGYFLDKFGIKNIVSASILICAFGSFLFICTSNYYVALIGRLFVGFGSASGFCACLKIGNNWFPKQYIGLVTTATVALGVLGPIFGVPIFAEFLKYYEWKEMLIYFSLAGVVLAIYTMLVVKDHKPGEVHVKEARSPLSMIESLKIILTEKNTYFMFIYGFCAYSPISAFADMWGISFLQSTYPAISLTDAAILSNSLYFGMIFGPILSVPAEKFGKVNIMIMSSIAMSICFGLVIFCHNLSYYLIYALIALTGFFTTGQLFMYPLAYSTMPTYLTGLISGVINMSGMLSGSILQPILGFVLDACWDGTLVNGAPSYNTKAYVSGLSIVFGMLVISILIPKFIKERKAQSSA